MQQNSGQDSAAAAGGTKPASLPSSKRCSLRYAIAFLALAGPDPWQQLQCANPVALAQWCIAWAGQIGAVRAWYQSHLERLYDYATARAGDLDQLEQIARSHPSRERFLSELTLEPPDARGAKAGRPSLDEGYLILSTIIRNVKTSWAEVLNQNGVPDSAREVHTDNEWRALAAEYEVLRARAENEKLRETVMQLPVDRREQAARHRLGHHILDGVKQAGQALRALAIAFDGIALVRRQLAARLRDRERRTRRVVIHGLAAAGIALAIGIVAFFSLQDAGKLGGPSVQSGTMASSR